MKSKIFFSNKTVDTNYTDVATVNNNDCEVLGVQIKNNGSVPLSGFKFQARLASTGDYVDIKTANFLDSDMNLLYASDAVDTLAAGSSVIMYFNMTMFDDFRIQAKVSSSTTTLSGVLLLIKEV